MSIKRGMQEKLQIALEHHSKNTKNIKQDDGHFILNDERNLKSNTKLLLKEVVGVNTEILSLRNHDGYLGRAIKRSFRDACAQYCYHSENIPPISDKTMQVTLEKTCMVINYVIENAGFLTQAWVESKYISMNGLSRAISDTVFYFSDWESTEAKDVIYSLLYSFAFGRVSACIINKVINSVEYKGRQPLCSSRNIPAYANQYSWLRFARYARNNSKKIYSDYDRIEEKAVKLIDYRIPETIAILSRVNNYLGGLSVDERMFLDGEPSIIDMANINKRIVHPDDVRLTVEWCIDYVKDVDQEKISLLRGLLAFLYPKTNRFDLEKILSHCELIKKELQLNVSKPIGLKDSKWADKYYSNGIRCLIDDNKPIIQGEAKLCKTVEFYYSIVGSNKPPFCNRSAK